jgi:CheY-like chemotaxis protein
MLHWYTSCIYKSFEKGVCELILQQKRIVIVDDLQTLALLLKELLEAKGYTVVVHDNPILALREILINGASLVISDYNMPFMNGIELLQKVKKANPHIKQILITASKDSIVEYKEFMPIVEKTGNFYDVIICTVNKLLLN